MWTERQYELAAKLADDERQASLETLRRQMRADEPGSPDGLCRDCDEHIGQARLAARPGVIRCIECQVIYEKKRQQKKAGY